MKAFKIIGIGVCGLLLSVGCIGAAFGLQWAGIQWDGFFAVERENVRREVFEATKSYNEAKEQELLKHRLEYMRTDDPAEKEAIAFTVRHAFADYDEKSLSPELQEFLVKIKYDHD